MTRLDVVMTCAACPEFVTEWSRLRGVGFPRHAPDRLIDDATGYSADIARLFIDDVIDLVISRLPDGEAAA